MASKSKETRLKQKATLEAKLQKRLALLAEKGDRREEDRAGRAH